MSLSQFYQQADALAAQGTDVAPELKPQYIALAQEFENLMASDPAEETQGVTH